MQGKPPAARDGHTACVIGSRIYIFGGYEEEVGISEFVDACIHYIILITGEGYIVPIASCFSSQILLYMWVEI